MILDPSDAIADGHVTLDEHCVIEGSGFLLPLMKVFFVNHTTAHIGNGVDVSRCLPEVRPITYRTTVDYWKLVNSDTYQGVSNVYKGVSNIKLSLAGGMVGVVTPTPLLVENGIMINSAILDSYSESVEFTILVHADTYFAVGAPVAKLTIFDNDGGNECE